MVKKKVKIFYGDIGSVGNELSKFMDQVEEIVSLTQSINHDSNYSNPKLIIVLVYIESFQ